MVNSVVEGWVVTALKITTEARRAQSLPENLCVLCVSVVQSFIAQNDSYCR